MEETCAACGRRLAPDERLCPNCGHPTPALVEELRAQAARTGQPYEVLLALVRAEHLIDRAFERVSARLDRLDVRVSDLEARLRRVEEAARAVEAESPPPPAEEGRAEAPPSPAAPGPAPTEAMPEPTAATPTPSPAHEKAAVAERIVPERLPRREPSWSLGDLEDLVSRRGLAWLGGLALLLGAVFFLSLAFSRGWIGPAARVTIGLAAGTALGLLGAWFFDRRERLFGHVLVAVGIGVLSMSLLAAARLYQLIPVEAGLAGTLVTAIMAAIIAIRASSQVVAGYGLVAALVAPPLLGASPSGVTIAYISALLVGTTIIGLYRAWRWLPALAFVLSAPQVAGWIVSEPPMVNALAALAGFWLLHAIAAGGEEYRVRRNVLGITSTTLLLANVAFVIWAGFRVLDGEAEMWRGAFLVLVALAHFAIAGYFLRAEGDRHPFGLLAAGTGVAALSMAVPVQFGGPWVPIAWAAEATALAWLYAQRRHGYSAVLAVILGLLAAGHLVTIEYPVWEIVIGRPSQYPFVNASGGTLAFSLAALAVAGYLSHSRSIRVVLIAAGFLLVIYALPFELSDRPLLAGWSALFAAAVGLERRVVLPRIEASTAPTEGSLRYLADRALYLPAIGAAELAAAHAFLYDLPPTRMGVALPARPFTDQYTLAAAILIGASLAAGALAGGALARSASIVASAAVAAYLMPFELESAATVVAWAALAFALGLIARWDVAGRVAHHSAAAGLLGLGLLVTLGEVAPPDRLAVDARSAVDHPLLWSGATAALGAIIVVLVAGYRQYHRTHRQARWLAVLAASLTVYLLSVGVVDEFQRRVDGATPLEELQKQAQVALSILWGVLGVVAFVLGIARRRVAIRSFGLALLALTTAKVYLYDLASLDAAYRVLSFVGLGILLLISSYLYQRFAPRLTDDHGVTQGH